MRFALTLFLLYVWISSFLAVSFPLRVARAVTAKPETFAIVLPLVTAARVTARLVPKPALTSTMAPNKYGEWMPAELVVSGGVTPPQLLLPQRAGNLNKMVRPRAGFEKGRLNRIFENRFEIPTRDEWVYTFTINRYPSGSLEGVEVRITVLFQ